MRETGQRRVVVVLGMHRSGTSLVARGVAALGVYLGESLLQPTEENAFGYWEDTDVVRLNDRVLAALGASWDSVAPMDLRQLDTSQHEQLRQEAIELISRKFDRALWGFKDPRTARLLRFWQPIFDELGLAPSYVIVIRRPSCVARSLATRGLSRQRSNLLWLQHYLAAVAHTHETPRVVVDYDRVLAAPVGEMRRIASQLILELEPVSHQAVEDYERGFVNPALRHHLSDEGDEAPTGFDGRIREVDQILLDLATDRRSPAERSLPTEWSQQLRRFEEITPWCEWVDTVEGRLQHLTREHRSLVRDYARVLERAEAADRDRDRLRSQYETLAAAFRSTRRVAREFEEISRKHDAVSKERDAVSSELDAVYRSRSWRVTAPLRFGYGALRRLLSPRAL